MSTTARADHRTTPASPDEPEQLDPQAAVDPRLINHADLTRIIRAAIVMNGGISYAVWMGGVTEELDRARLSGVSTTDDTCASREWHEILTLANTDLIVDVIAGTSAGGLNGAALATGIANRVKLPVAVKSLWMDGASLTTDTLLKPPAPGRYSVLSGDYFLDAVKEMLGKIVEKGEPVRSDAVPDDVALVVTTSKLDAGELQAATRPDGKVLLGAPNHVNRVDFRHQHHLMLQSGSYVPNPASDFVDADADRAIAKRDELASAGRASAGFPFAFHPLRWEEHDHLDGGLLDNTPFRPVMDEITNRPRSDSGERWLVYVTPGGGRDPVSAGPGWSGILSPLLSLMREADLASDDEALSHAIDEFLQGSVSPEEILRPPSPPDPRNPTPNQFALPTPELVQMAEHLLKAYQLCRAREYQAKYSWDLTSTLSNPPVGFPQSVQACRPQNGVPTWQWGVSAAQRMARRISREARSTGRVICRQDRDAIAAQEHKLSAIADFQWDQIKPIGAFTVGNRPQLRAALDRTYAFVYEPMQQIVSIWSQARGLNEAEGWQRVLATEVLSQAVVWRSKDPFPEFGLHQIIPCKLNDHTQLWAEKLYAGRLGGFGAFLAEPFRRHDWCWGRLDAAVTLVNALLADADATVRQDHIERLRERICEEECVDPDRFLKASAVVATLGAKEVISLARDQYHVDVRPLRHALVEYVVSDKEVRDSWRPGLRFALNLAARVFLWSLPKAPPLP